MSRIFAAALAFALCAAPALAADDMMANFIGNTVVSTGGMAEVHTHYRADHGFDMVGSAMGITRTFKGTWSVDAKGNLCRSFDGDAPPDTPNPLCNPLTPHKVGDTWTADFNGKTRTLTLKAGLQ